MVVGPTKDIRGFQKWVKVFFNPRVNILNRRCRLVLSYSYASDLTKLKAPPDLIDVAVPLTIIYTNGGRVGTYCAEVL